MLFHHTHLSRSFALFLLSVTRNLDEISCFLLCGRARARCCRSPSACPSSFALSPSSTDSPTTFAFISNGIGTTNNETIVIPRFYKDDVPEGSYPSALHSIHVESFLTLEQAEKCRDLAKAYAAESGCWDRPDSRRHQTYATCGLLAFTKTF